MIMAAQCRMHTVLDHSETGIVGLSLTLNVNVVLLCSGKVLVVRPISHPTVLS
jgi:hypothetical protein